MENSYQIENYGKKMGVKNGYWANEWGTLIADGKWQMAERNKAGSSLAQEDILNADFTGRLRGVELGFRKVRVLIRDAVEVVPTSYRDSLRRFV